MQFYTSISFLIILQIKECLRLVNSVNINTKVKPSLKLGRDENGIKYYIDTTAHIYYNTDTSQIINITNKQIINLPNVGSTGRYILFMWGVFLIVLSGVLFYKNHFIIIGIFKK